VNATADLAVDGYSIVDLFDADTLAALRRFVDALDLPGDLPVLASCNDLGPSAARSVHLALRDLADEAVRRLLPDHEVFLASVITTGSSVGGEVELHQNLTYTDERRYRALLLWAPLVDVDAPNGALCVVPGSHRRTTGVRACGQESLPTRPHQDALRHLAVTVPIRAGQAMLYDAALVHGSHPNSSGSPLPVVALATAPARAGLVHFHIADGQLRGHSVNGDYFTAQSAGEVPCDYPELEPWATAVSAESFGRWLSETPASVPAVEIHAADVGPGIDRPPRISTRHCRGLLPMSPRPALRETALDLRLRRDGFVKFPLIDRASAERLREQYGTLHGWQGSGFEADLTNPDAAYRRRVSEMLGKSLDEVVGDHFADFDPYTRVYLCKWPGQGSDLYLHRDWMYVDEESGDRSYVVWIALQDVTAEEGQIQVLRHSHRIDRMLRGTHLNAEWIQHEEVIRERLLTVPVSAGEALVMDNGLVHCSLANHGGEPRVVAAVGMRPREANLVHYMRRDERTAARLAVDEDFFLSRTPGDLMAAAPPEGAVTVPTAERPLSASDLVKRLNTSPLTLLDNARRFTSRLARKPARVPWAG
jgi:ectoine hydroxylase-related dioxygenase (phytanoyl-CoA dioxygenase family)